MVACQQQKLTSIQSKHWLEGNWSAKAFSGRLDEYWKMDPAQGLILKSGYYIEGSDTSYAETVKVDTLEGSVFLVAKPFNADARIYTLKVQRNDSLVFENLIYRNPFRIIYKRIDANHFSRSIIGIEEGDMVQFQFDFERISN